MPIWVAGWTSQQVFEHNGDDLVSQGYAAKREVPRKQSRRSEEAKKRSSGMTCSAPNVTKKSCSSTVALCALLFIGGHNKVVEVSDGTVPSE